MDKPLAMPETDVYQESDKSIIVAYIKSFVRMNGYISTRYGIKHGLNGVRKNWDDGGVNHEWAFIKSVSSLAIADGEFIREISADRTDFDILLNPNHTVSQSVIETNGSIKKTNRNTVIIALSAAMFTGITAFFSIMDYFNTPELNQKDLQKLLQPLLQDIEKIKQSQAGIDSSLQKAVTDSFYQNLRKN